MRSRRVAVGTDIPADQAIGSNTEDTVVLLWMEGAQIGFNEDGTLHAINDATSIQYITETVSAAQGTPVPYIHGGAAARP